MTSLALAALFWVALHLIVAGPARVELARRLGEGGFRLGFSVLSLAGVVWLALAYRAAPEIWMWGPLPGARAAALVLVLIAFVLLAYGASAGNPTAVAAAARGSPDLPIAGITRITRHPMLWAFALWAAAHLYANGDAASGLMFGAILVTALNGMASIDRKRRRALGAGWDEFAARTSLVPFAAILAGRNAVSLKELSPTRAVLGVALFAAALWLHPHVIGVAPLAG